MSFAGHGNGRSSFFIPVSLIPSKFATDSTGTLDLAVSATWKYLTTIDFTPFPVLDLPRGTRTFQRDD